MKKIILVLLVAFSIKATAQNEIIRDKVTAKLKLQLGAYEIDGISDDTTGMQSALRKGFAITEHAAKTYSKNYADSVAVLDWHSIVKKGADMTGSTDITSFLTAAESEGKKVFYLPKGRFRISSTYQLKDSMMFIGDAGHQTFIVVDGNFPAFKASLSQGGNNTVFRNIGFIGTGIGVGTTSQCGILIDSAQRITIDGISGYNMAGFVVEIRNNGYCCATYQQNATRANYVINSYFENCYGGVYLNSRAEYNSVANNIITACTYAVWSVGGNNRITNNSGSNCSYGLVLSGGSNNGHGVVNGNTFNHNSVYNLYVTGVTNGMELTGNIFCAGSPGKIKIESSNNIHFVGGLLLTGDSIIVTSCTNTRFTDPIYWLGNPLWGVTGEAPNVVMNGKTNKAVSILDVANNKEGYFKYDNGIASIGGSIDTLKVTGVFQTPNITQYPTMDTTNTKLSVVDANGNHFKSYWNIPGLLSGSGTSTRLALWSGSSSLSSDAALTWASNFLNITASSSSSPGLFVKNTNTSAGAGAVVQLVNNNNAGFQYFMGATGNSFIPNGGSIYSSDADFLNISLTKSGAFFGVNNNFNRNNGTIAMRVYTTTGNTTLGTATDDGFNRLQVSGNINTSDTVKAKIISARNVIYKTTTSADADITATPGTAYILTEVEAFRNFNLPASPLEGDILEIYNTVPSGALYNWAVVGDLYNPLGEPVTEFERQKHYIIRYAGAAWRATVIY